MSQTSISSCSKGSRGLSVFLRVLGIFTETTISPSPSLRQRPSRYAIRAGRNLPDKEFRYLRTVIVTAAIHQGFDSELPPALNPPSQPFPNPKIRGKSSPSLKTGEEFSLPQDGGRVLPPSRRGKSSP